MDDFETKYANDPYAQTFVMLEKRRIQDTVTLLGLVYRIAAQHGLETPQSMLAIIDQIASTLDNPEDNLILNTAKTWSQRQGPQFSVIDGGKAKD